MFSLTVSVCLCVCACVCVCVGIGACVGHAWDDRGSENTNKEGGGGVLGEGFSGSSSKNIGGRRERQGEMEGKGWRERSRALGERP